MSSLRVRGEPVQLFLKFLGSNVVELKNTKPPIQVENVKNSNVVELKNTKPPIQVENVKEDSSSLKLYLQKVGLKDKSKHLEKKKPHPQYICKIKVEHVENQ
jgi:hypothetical protein